tara:strand:+ start:5153 stop:5917 length:765 start_codon:yes stop_codon:yes gene_type:complete
MSKKLKCTTNNFHIQYDIISIIIPYLHYLDRLNLKITSNYYNSYYKKYKFYKKVNLIYVIDTTASMIDPIENIIDDIFNINKYFYNVNINYNLIEFNDHIITNNIIDNPTIVHKNIKNVKIFNKILKKIDIDNGGDLPEAIADALYEVNKLNLDNKNTNIIIFISDAYPHGIDKTNDRYPNGCPCSINYKNELKKINKNNIKFIFYDLKKDDDIDSDSVVEKYYNQFKKEALKLSNGILLSGFDNIKKFILSHI